MILGLATLGLALLVWSLLERAARASQLPGAFAGRPSRPGLMREHDPRGDADPGPGTPRYSADRSAHPSDSGQLPWSSRCAGRGRTNRSSRRANGRSLRRHPLRSRWDLVDATTPLADGRSKSRGRSSRQRDAATKCRNEIGGAAGRVGIATPRGAPHSPGSRHRSRESCRVRRQTSRHAAPTEPLPPDLAELGPSRGSRPWRHRSAKTRSRERSEQPSRTGDLVLPE